MHYAEPTTAVRKLATAMETKAKAHDWISPATGQAEHEKWSFEAKLEKDLCPTGFSPRYVNGQKLLTEHLPTEDEEQ